jgi:subtilisin family serine protease
MPTMQPDSPAFSPALLARLLVAALIVAPVAARAHVGDVVALVDAHALSSLVPPAGSAGGASAAGAAAALRDGHEPLAAASAPLAQALTAHGLDVALGLGPALLPDGDVAGPAALAEDGGALRLVLFSTSSPGGLAPGDAAAAARDLVARGLAKSAAPDIALKLFNTVPNDTDEVTQETYLTGPGGVKVEQAWDITQGSSSVIIGVIDTGVDTGHPDLASKIWTNPGEIPGNGIDDDGDGYIDDVHGWDFGDNDNDPNPTVLLDSDGLDEGFHGTAVAGCAAAATNNITGGAGVGWNSMVLPMKFSDTAGNTLVSYAAEAMHYASAHHLQVLNMSFGAPNPDSLTQALFQQLVNQANAAGVVCVAAAGNEGSSVQAVPAACTGTLSVGSITSSNTRSSFSNFGPWVNICAPGELLWEPISRNYTLDATSAFVYEFFFGYDGETPYMYSSGTSLSTPVVSGAVALVRARFPTAAPYGVILHMLQTGDVITFDQPIGVKLNVYQAVAQTLDAPELGPAASVALLALAPARPSPFAGGTSLSFRLAKDLDATLTVVDVSGRTMRSLASGTLAAGPHVVAWDGRDDAGRAAPPGLYFAVLTGGGTRAVTRLVRIE